MDFFVAAAKRYSHKARFAGPAVPRDDLRKIVEAGIQSPSGGNRQSPEFVIIDDPATISELGRFTTNPIMASAPALIAIVSRPRMRVALDFETECLIADNSVAALSVILAATALGYCSGWLDHSFLNRVARELAQALLGIPDDRLLVMVVPVGHAGEESARRVKKPFEQRASWDRYEVDR